MKTLLLLLFAFNASSLYPQEHTWKKSPSEIAWNRLFHRMTFREPVVFTPFEVKMGYFGYGGKNYWSGTPMNNTSVTPDDMPVLLDSTQYQFSIIEALSNRQGVFVEVDFLRTNLPHFMVHQNYVDLQLGLGFQYIDFLSKTELPAESGKDWLNASTRGNYLFHPKSMGLNLNTSLSWQLARNRLSYIYHSFGVSNISIYESEGGDKTLTGWGLTENFGIGLKFILNQGSADFNYTLGVEAKWNRLYITKVTVPEDFSPIYGLDLRASGIFLTTGIQFGGKPTDGDFAYTYMQENDFIAAAEYFESFLAKERRHGKRQQAVEFLHYCQSQIPYQQVNLGIEDIMVSEIDSAVAWFEAAEQNADEDLMEEILAQRERIAIQLLDSVQFHKGRMNFSEAEKLVENAETLFPGLVKAEEVLAGLYIDKAKLSVEVGDYLNAVTYYKKALEQNASLKPFISGKLESLTQLLIKDAYFSALDDNLYLTLESLRTIVEIHPKSARELDSYIVKLETKLETSEFDKKSQAIQDYVEQKKLDSLPAPDDYPKIGMTKEEILLMMGNPSKVTNFQETTQTYEIWTFRENNSNSYFYFDGDFLVKID